MSTNFKKLSTKTIIVFYSIMCVILLLEAIFQWKIHVLLWENSHVMSGLIQTEWFYVSNQRVGMYFTQILPFIGLKLNFPDGLVLILQSLNYTLLPLFIIGWLFFVWKDIPTGVFIFFILSLGGFYIHFAKEYALVNSLVYSLVLASFIKVVFNPQKWFHYVVLVVLLVLIAYTFTLALFFVIPLLLVNYKKLGWKTLFLSLSVIMGVFLVTFIQSKYIMNNVAAVGVTGDMTQGTHAVVQSLKKIGFYYSTIVLAIITIIVLIKKKADYIMLFVWGVYLVFLTVALRYLISVCGITFSFDISDLVLIRVEVTLFIIVASLIYFSCVQLGWSKNLLYVLLILSVGRFVFLNVSSKPVNDTIASKEVYIQNLVAEYPNKKIFLVDRKCDFIPKNYELDDFKHESYIMSTYLGTPIVTYLTNHFETYMVDGRPQFVNKNYTESVDLYDDKTYSWRFDPILEYRKMKINQNDIQKVECE